MFKTNGLAELLGERAETPRRAVSDLWVWDFKDAPGWFLRKYFTDERGYLCGRMRVANYAKLGAIVRKGGVVVTKRNGRPQTLTTSYLARLVEDDLAKAGYPGLRVHFRGYSLEPDRFALDNPYAQEEYEENEARHVPGLDPEEDAEPSNGQASLDRDVWEWLAAFMVNALHNRTIMYWGVDEDFVKVMCAGDFVPAALNAEFASLKGRLEALQTQESALWPLRKGVNDFSMFELNDVVRVYTRAMRALTGLERGEQMGDYAWLMDPGADDDYVRKLLPIALSRGEPECREAVMAMVLANLDPTDDDSPVWRTECERSLLDDDSGELATDMLLCY